MFKFLLKVLLSGLAFCFIFPHINGIEFRGGFGTACFLAICFSLLLKIIELAVTLVGTIMTVASLGLALLVIIPLWICCFWLLPAAALWAVAGIFPDSLVIDGWWPAAQAGLVLLVVSLITGPVMKTVHAITGSKDR